MSFLGPVYSTWLFLVVGILFWSLIIVTVFKLLQVLFELNNVLDDVRKYIRRRS